MNVVSLRPIARGLGHPPLGWLAGRTAKRSRSPEELGKDASPPSTVMSALYRFTDATAGKIFVRDSFSVSLFSCTAACTAKNEAPALLRVSPRLGCKVFARITKEF